MWLNLFVLSKFLKKKEKCTCRLPTWTLQSRLCFMCHIQPVQWLHCFAHNSTIISLCLHNTHMSEWGRPHYCVYGGLNLCEHEGRSERGGRQRQKEREEKVQQDEEGFLSPSQIFFFLLVMKNQSLKVLVTPKQFNHCFDNSDSSRHSSSSRTWTTVDLSVWYGFH